ncbi:MAG: TolC family protein [Flavobacteriales bacterium]|nr:TolC family protein [Flavobacteriia bacterium]NCP52919.1 TolC family protein [Flavobacteriales bacterium]
MKKSGLYAFLFITSAVFAQEQLSLNQCYQWLDKNYPMVKQRELFEKQNSIDSQIITNKTLPQLNLEAQATYQSEVTQVPIPNTGIDPLNKDQYRATATLNQLIYNDGFINASLEAKSAHLKTQKKQIEVNLYALKKEVNQLYFSILLLQEKKALLNAKKDQLNSRISEVKSGIEYGVILPASDKVLEAELIKIQQQFDEIGFNKKSMLNTLSSLIGFDLNDDIILENPHLEVAISNQINRPEIDLFNLKKEEIQANEQLLSKQKAPKLFGFATGGYGNPGLNMLDNSFTGFYTVGLKLNWNVFDWNSNKKERQSLSINKDIIDNETEIFNLNTNMELRQQELEMKKIETFIASDSNIIALRKDVLQSAESQLKNGVITSSAYITELTHLFEDENNLKTHIIQLLLVKANYNINKGQ